jgi:hypothetical protein
MQTGQDGSTAIVLDESVEGDEVLGLGLADG